MKNTITFFLLCIIGLTARSQDSSTYHRVGVSYDFTHFGKQFNKDWHLGSIEYMRQARSGAYIGKVNTGYRYGQSGFQLEAEAYPRINKTFYAYGNLGYSPDFPVFPKFRAGFSLFANLPHAFEADAGFRYLNFDNDTWLYTASIGKYVGNFWFNFRTYLTPHAERVDQSYNFTTRYYLKSAEDYVYLLLNSGISPDDRSQAVQLNTNFKLETKKIAAGWRYSFARNIVFLQAGYSRVEYKANEKDDQINLALSYMIKF